MLLHRHSGCNRCFSLKVRFFLLKYAAGCKQIGFKLAGRYVRILFLRGKKTQIHAIYAHQRVARLCKRNKGTHIERLQLPDRRHLRGDKEPPPRPGSATATPPLGDNKRRTSTPSAPRRRSHAPANITADQKKNTRTHTHAHTEEADRQPCNGAQGLTESKLTRAKMAKVEMLSHTHLVLNE